MGSATKVAIIGAGPYGLSIAAHLSGQAIEHRIFGVAMDSWRRTMPAGMKLKSEGFASSLYDPQGRLTLKKFCLENGLAYGDRGFPLPLETINAYGLAFQKRFVPELEDETVVALEPADGGHRLRLASGETFAARHVVVATGINYFRYIPPQLERLPPEHLSHSSQHHDLGALKGRKVVVIGAGASAIDTAGLLAEQGVEVELVCRRRVIDWLEPPSARERSLWESIRYPMSGLAPGIRSRFYEDFPMVFRHLPRAMRLHIVATFLGPAPPAWMKELVIGRMPVSLGCQVLDAATRKGRVHLRLQAADGGEEEVVGDHVIAATGFKIDLRRLPFLGDALVRRISTVAGAPALSAAFETSVPGLHFAGVTAANTFGPLMRFMLGANYTARRLTRHLGPSARRRPMTDGVVSVGPARA